MIGICHRKKKNPQNTTTRKLKHGFQEQALKEKQPPHEPSAKNLGNGDILLILRFPLLLHHSVHFKMEAKPSTKKLQIQCMVIRGKTFKNSNVQKLYKHSYYLVYADLKYVLQLFFYAYILQISFTKI